MEGGDACWEERGLSEDEMLRGKERASPGSLLGWLLFRFPGSGFYSDCFLHVYSGVLLAPI